MLKSIAVTMLIAASLQAKPPKQTAPAKAQETKQEIKQPDQIVWNYSTPDDYQFLEPSYRFPLQVKQALTKYVKNRQQLEEEFDSIYKDEEKFKPWIVKVLEDFIQREKKIQSSTDQTADKLKELHKECLDNYEKSHSNRFLREAEDISRDIYKKRQEAVSHMSAWIEAERILKIVKQWASPQ